MSSVLSLNPTYYKALKRLTLELAGVNLGGDHRFLVETRLSALARKEGFEDLTQMIDELFSRGQTRLAIHVVSALLQRANSFFEDRQGFETLGDVLLPSLHPLYRGGKIRILSYGCSGGQEVYSTAIVIDKISHVLPDVEFEIVGVDYPSWALERAKEGRFTHFEVQRGLPIRHLIEYFDKTGEDWVIKSAIRDKVQFIDHNLLADIGELGTFQIVMFRGRLEQYSAPAAIRILRSLASLITANGFLMLGTDETMNKVNYGFDKEPIAPGCYKKQPKEEPLIGNQEDAPRIPSLKEIAAGSYVETSTSNKKYSAA